MDCVLNNLNEMWIKSYNIHYNDCLTIEDIHTWDMTEHVKEECGKNIYKLLDSSLFESLIPMPYSIEVTRELSKEHELYVVTATHHASANVKIEWLLKHFPHISKRNIIICECKDIVNVDLLVDDGAHNIEAFPNDTIVFDYAWNRSLGDTYKRAKSWLEVKDIINELNYKGE